MFKNLLKKGIPLGLAVIIVLLTMLLTFQITYLTVNNKYAKLLDEITVDQNKYAKLAAVDKLFRTYGIYEFDEKELSDLIITGYVAGTGDKHAYYYTAEEFAELTSVQDGEFDGIGVTVIYNYEQNAIEIISVEQEGPAEEGGVLPGDLIVAVDGTPVSGLGYYGAIAEIKGKAGTEVNITIARSNGLGFERFDFNIKRAPVTDHTVSHHMYEGDNSEMKLGIVMIQSFDLITPEQFFSAMDDLLAQGAEGFIFDLRYNPGGDLSSITKILDYLLPEGPIIRIHYKSGEEEVMKSDANYLNMPLAVLINGRTASAAELFSAAIKDYELGTLVGTTTYGKGTMQATMPLEDNSAVVISIAKYNPPFSDNYDGVGIAPDVEVELDEELQKVNRFKIADIDDNQLQTAIAVLNGNMAAESENAAG